MPVSLFFDLAESNKMMYYKLYEKDNHYFDHR